MSPSLKQAYGLQSHWLTQDSDETSQKLLIASVGAIHSFSAFLMSLVLHHRSSPRHHRDILQPQVPTTDLGWKSLSISQRQYAFFTEC